jgi:hypothetical protein
MNHFTRSGIWKKYSEYLALIGRAITIGKWDGTESLIIWR